MNTEQIIKTGVVGYNVTNINNTEMHQMVTMKDKIGELLLNHQDKTTKNKYLSDDELKTLFSILRVLTRNSCDECISSFDEELHQIDKEIAMLH